MELKWTLISSLLALPQFHHQVNQKEYWNSDVGVQEIAIQGLIVDLEGLGENNSTIIEVEYKITKWKIIGSINQR